MILESSHWGPAVVPIFGVVVAIVLPRTSTLMVPPLPHFATEVLAQVSQMSTTVTADVRTVETCRNAVLNENAAEIMLRNAWPKRDSQAYELHTKFGKLL